MNGANGSASNVVRSRKTWVWILAALCVVVVGLVVAIIVVNVIQGGEGDGECTETGYVDAAARASAEALELQETVIQRLRDGDYNIDDAMAEFEKAIDGSSGDEMAAFVLYYVDFIDRYNYDAMMATRILEEVDLSEMSDKTVENYYVALRELYGKIGDTEKYDYYEGLLNELVPQEIINIGADEI